jgi:predicted DNA-binding transcriptional regulator AlpA
MPASSTDATEIVEPTRLRLADVVADPGLVDSLDRSQLAGALVEVSAVLARLAARATTIGQVEARDTLLTADELAQYLNTTVDWVRHGDFPFAVRMSSGLIRYSKRGCDAWIKKRTGAKTWRRT